MLRDVGCCCLAFCLSRLPLRTGAPRLAIPDETVAEQLDDVPVFGILLREDAKLYGGDDGQTMVYMSLQSASRVLAQLQSTYPETEIEIAPLPLGNVLTQTGYLQRPPATDDDNQPALPIELVSSPDERRAARKIREDVATPRPAARSGVAGKLQDVPIFHIGSVEDPDPAKPAFWPFFFRTADVDALWRQLGEGAPRPEVTATDLAALIDGLRLADNAPAKPLICAPLDAIEFMRGRDEVAMEAAKAAKLQAKVSEQPSEEGGAGTAFLL